MRLIPSQMPILTITKAGVRRKGMKTMGAGEIARVGKIRAKVLATENLHQYSRGLYDALLDRGIYGICNQSGTGAQAFV
jgi:hypothetical protein